MWDELVLRVHHGLGSHSFLTARNDPQVFAARLPNPLLDEIHFLGRSTHGEQIESPGFRVHPQCCCHLTLRVQVDQQNGFAFSG